MCVNSLDIRRINYFHVYLSISNEELKKIPKPVVKERKVFTIGVGKYTNPAMKKEARKAEDDGQIASTSKKKKTNNYSFSDFSSW